MRGTIGGALLLAVVTGGMLLGSRSVLSAEEGKKDLPRAEQGVLPAEIRGFSGQARGTVVGKAEGTFEFKVAEVMKTWKKNTATKPEALAGHTIRVTPRRARGDGDQVKTNQFHLAFIRKLQVGQEHVLELVNEEGNQFALLELTKEQREMAGVPNEGVKGDRKR